MIPQDHGRRGPLWAKMDFDDWQQQVVLTLYGGAWHWWLSCRFLVCGLGGLSARQGWATVMIICYVQSIGLVGPG